MRLWLCGVLILVASLAGCQSMLYGALEQVGVEKRHILVDRVEDGREDQREAQEQFQTTLEAFQAVTSFDGGDLEVVYDDLHTEYERSEARAEAVRDRIDSIEHVAAALFDEWEDEIGEISDATLRAGSKRRLKDTRRAYAKLIAAMRRAADRMAPVLTAFRDRVLYLKHNLNAAAIASLEGDLTEIQGDVQQLIDELNLSIAEADAFLGKIER
ncbi:MAG: DUF2959 domain-containing protein [bacterium]|nr:DUF2959 domain-containing protein [bacterium]